MKLLFAFLIITVSMQLPIVTAQNNSKTTATYRLTVKNNWTEELYPAAYPIGAHFSWLAAAKHNANQSFWELGGMASAGFQELAETGYSEAFLKEIQAPAIPFGWQHWFCSSKSLSSKCGVLTVEFIITSDQPLITLASMLGPSPDWFVGVSGLNLQPNNNWIENLTVPLALYDAGTEDGLEPTMTNPESKPHRPISLIRYDESSGKYIPTNKAFIVGEFIFELINISE